MRQACRALWHGDGRNRFFDKSIQLVVFPNGKAGMIGEVRLFVRPCRVQDGACVCAAYTALYCGRIGAGLPRCPSGPQHSSMDGMPTSRYADFICERCVGCLYPAGSVLAPCHAGLRLASLPSQNVGYRPDGDVSPERRRRLAAGPRDAVLPRAKLTTAAPPRRWRACLSQPRSRSS